MLNSLSIPRVKRSVKKKCKKNHQPVKLQILTRNNHFTYCITQLNKFIIKFQKFLTFHTYLGLSDYIIHKQSPTLLPK